MTRSRVMLKTEATTSAMAMTMLDCGFFLFVEKQKMVFKTLMNFMMLAAAAFAGYRLFQAWIVQNMAHVKLWGAVLAGILIVQIFFVLPLLGGIRLDADSNKMLTERTVDFKSGEEIIRTIFKHPDSFEDYVFVYDPTEVFFDAYSVNHRRQKSKLNSGRRSGSTGIFPPDPSKRMISISSAAGASQGYRQPRSSRDGTFIHDITIQFFYGKGDKNDDEHAEKLEKFNAILTKGQFMIKRGNTFVEVERSTR